MYLGRCFLIRVAVVVSFEEIRLRMGCLCSPVCLNAGKWKLALWLPLQKTQPNPRFSHPQASGPSVPRDTPYDTPCIYLGFS